MFWDFLMFYQIFVPPQVKRRAIITYKDGIWYMPLGPFFLNTIFPWKVEWWICSPVWFYRTKFPKDIQKIYPKNSRYPNRRYQNSTISKKFSSEMKKGNVNSAIKILSGNMKNGINKTNIVPITIKTSKRERGIPYCYQINQSQFISLNSKVLT